jgi:lytic cellulose monooxygenase (C1-hydroxylating)
MGLMPNENVTVQDVDFFKVDEAGYTPETKVWGTDQLIMDNSTRKFTIPSDIKPGMYVVRHEIIGLHFAWKENTEKKTSGAQLYPVCFSKWSKKRIDSGDTC